jgi:hypothetical protein
MPSFTMPASADLGSACTFFMGSILSLRNPLRLIAEHAENGQFFPRPPTRGHPSGVAFHN